jgi:hypothetical protein
MECHELTRITQRKTAGVLLGTFTEPRKETDPSCRKDLNVTVKRNIPHLVSLFHFGISGSGFSEFSCGAHMKIPNRGEQGKICGD